MRLNKKLKLEGLIIVVLLTLEFIGLYLWYSPVDDNFYLGPVVDILKMVASNLFIIIVAVATPFYWLWKVAKYQKQENEE